MEKIISIINLLTTLVKNSTQFNLKISTEIIWSNKINNSPNYDKDQEISKPKIFSQSKNFKKETFSKRKVLVSSNKKNPSEII